MDAELQAQNFADFDSAAYFPQPLILPTSLPLRLPPSPHSPSLVSSLPLFTFLQTRVGAHYEGISWLERLRYKKECLTSSVSLSGFNYCRQALSRLHQASITSNAFLFELWERGARSHCRFSMPPPLSATLPVHIRLHEIRIVPFCLAHSLVLSAPSDLIPKESNFALTQNSRSKHQSPDFMAFVGIRRSVQNKPRRGILLVREEGDYSEPVQISSADSLSLSHALFLCT